MWMDEEKAWSPSLGSPHLLKDSPGALSWMSGQDKSKNDFRTLENILS